MNQKNDKMNIESAVFKVPGKNIIGMGLNFSDAKEKDLEHIAVKSINTALENKNLDLECYFGNKNIVEKYLVILKNALKYLSERYYSNKINVNYSRKKISFENGSTIRVS